MLTSLERNVLVANRIARILAICSFTLLVVLVTSFGANINTPLIFALGAFFLTIPWLNRRGHYNFTRIAICAIPVIATFTAALLAKVFGKGYTDMLFYDSRFFLLIFAIVPCLIFEMHERWQLFSTLMLVFLALALFDPVHELLGVGYFQVGFTGRSYYYINFAVIMTFFAITAGALALKRVIAKTERLNEEYRQTLQETNQKLQESINDIEAQNEEIVAQSEELITGQESLIRANQIIEKQKIALEQKVTEVNAELQEANEELVKHNNELQQFSFSLSHHLRGPIARILGLANILRFLPDLPRDGEAAEVIHHIDTSVQELDTVVRELNSIVDIRRAMYQVREDVDFNTVWEDVAEQLDITETVRATVFRVDFQAAPTVFSVRPMVTSIMLNLVSNALKFRSPARTLQVRITTRRNQQYTTLTVADNGLGIDLSAFQNDLFKMYKRFHDRHEGKGLGLYMIKSQVDQLNGFVDINSTPDKGSEFVVHLKHSE